MTSIVASSGMLAEAEGCQGKITRPDSKCLANCNRSRHARGRRVANGMKNLSQVLVTALPGLEQLVAEERPLLGEMAYKTWARR